MQTTTTMRIRTTYAQRKNRRLHRGGGHPGPAAWRAAPATAEQIQALREIAMENGHTFEIGINRGAAWRRIHRRRRCSTRGCGGAAPRPADTPPTAG